MTAAPDSGGPLADELAGRILAAAKYRNLDEGLVRRVAAEAALRFTDRGEALKYAKRKLHQMFGAFLHGSPVRAVHEAVAAVSSGNADLRTAALGAMRAHASSAERIPWLAPFYEQVGQWCGMPRSVADLGCGLNPLAIPWMRLAPDASYWACEIDAALVAALASLDQIMPTAITVHSCDLVAAPPARQADVAMLLKTVTTIERQDQAAIGRVLAALDCQHLIMSLPGRSLSGRKQYSADPQAIVTAVTAGSRYRLSDSATFGDETLFHLVP